MNILTRKKFILIKIFDCFINQLELGFTIIPYLTSIRWRIFYLQIKFGVYNLMMAFRMEWGINSSIHYQVAGNLYFDTQIQQTKWRGSRKNSIREEKNGSDRIFKKNINDLDKIPGSFPFFAQIQTMVQVFYNKKPFFSRNNSTIFLPK